MEENKQEGREKGIKKKEYKIVKLWTKVHNFQKFKDFRLQFMKGLIQRKPKSEDQFYKIMIEGPSVQILEDLICKLLEKGVVPGRHYSSS